MGPVRKRAAALATLCALVVPAAARADEPIRTEIIDMHERRDAGEAALLWVTSIAWMGAATPFFDGLGLAKYPYATASFAVLLTPLSAGFGVIIPIGVDAAFGKRPGAAQTVTSAMLLGLGEGIALNEYFSNLTVTSFHTYTKDTSWIFAAPGAGLITGLVIDAFVTTTPGRAAWVATTGLFTGIMTGSVVGALEQQGTWGREGNRDVGIAAAIGGAAGIGAGIVTSRFLSPSQGRVHLIDLGWIAGATIPGLACINHCSAQGTFAAVAFGGAAGFTTAFIATAWMPRHVRGHDLPGVAPYILPLDKGVSVGIGGAL